MRSVDKMIMVTIHEYVNNNESKSNEHTPKETWLLHICYHWLRFYAWNKKIKKLTQPHTGKHTTPPSPSNQNKYPIKRSHPRNHTARGLTADETTAPTAHRRDRWRPTCLVSCVDESLRPASERPPSSCLIFRNSLSTSLGWTKYQTALESWTSRARFLLMMLQSVWVCVCRGGGVKSLLIIMTI